MDNKAKEREVSWAMAAERGRGMERTLHGMGAAALALMIAMAVMVFAAATPAMASQFTISLCSDCHGMPPQDSATRNSPAGAVKGTHTSSSTHTPTDTVNDCVVCHGSAVSSYITNHRNGMINMAASINGGTYSRGTSFAQGTNPTLGTCNNTYCHGTASPTWGTSGVLSCASCHAYNKTTLSGAHPVHINSTAVPTAINNTNSTSGNTYQFNCGVCHYVNPTGEHVDGSNGGALATNGYTVDVRFNVSWATINMAGSYSKGTGTTATGKSNSGGAGGGFTYWNASTCTTYCHSSGQNQTNGASGPSFYNTPSWNQSSRPCNGCHGFPPNNASHNTHQTFQISCYNCHAGTVDASNNIVGNHINGQINLGNLFVGGTYSQGNDQTPGNGYGQCSNIYCHGYWSGANYNSPTWGQAINCGDCHDATNQSPMNSPAVSNSHATHTGTGANQLQLKCGTCHGTAYYNTTAVPGHVDFNIDWAMNTTDPRVKSLAQYNGAASGTKNNRAPSEQWGSYGSCTNVYCHSTVQSLNGTTLGIYCSPTWSMNLNPGPCDQCHGNDSVKLQTGSHKAHVGAGYLCDDCHFSYGYYNTATHINNQIGVAAAGGNFASYSQAATNPPGNGFGYCTTIVCHGSTTATWNNPASANITCVTCHKTGNTFGAPAIQAEFEKSSHHVSGRTWSNYDKRLCAVCHAEGDDPDSTGLVLTNATYHKDKQVQLKSGTSRGTVYVINKGWLDGSSGTSAQRETTHQDLDDFCMSCHRVNGATGISGAGWTATTPWYNATNPFGEPSGSERKNTYDGFQRAFTTTGGLAVYDAFGGVARGSLGLTARDNHHAVLGKRYSGQYLTPYLASITLINGTTGQIKDSTTLHCADCHNSSVSGHGGTNDYMLSTSSAVDPSARHTTTTYVCLKCHVTRPYTDTNHFGNGSDFVDGRSGNGNLATGMGCLNCHDSRVPFGGIHGSADATYTTFIVSKTLNKRRFLPGSALRGYIPSGTVPPGTASDALWSSATTGACYTSTADTYSGCAKHADTKSGEGTPAANARSIPTRPVDY